MDQISRPLLLALVAVVFFAAAWMTVLRPQAAEENDAAPETAAEPPLGSGLTRAVDKAEGVAARSDAAARKAQEQMAVASGDGPAPAAENPAPAPKPATAASRPAQKPAPSPKPAREMRRTVLLFAGSGADDAVAREVVAAFRGRGVRTIIARLGDVERHRDLVGAVQITGAPTILVIGKDRRAQKIEGLPDEAQVRQALAAAR